MADAKIVQEWLIKADEDFYFAKKNLEEGHPFYAQICFHFQQAAEKYLKSYIVAHDLEFTKAHNLMNLLRICALREPSLLSLMDKCEILNTVYIDTRYPVQWPTDYTEEKALNLWKAVETIAQKIKEFLKEDEYI